MTRTSVKSSNLKSVGYDLQASLLEVEFLSGSVYQYREVPSTVWAELRRRMGSGESIGRYFNSNVKPRFPWNKIT